MKKSSLDALQLREMFIAGASHLTAQKELVDNLNVFPVPDGDTGTNMSLTVQAAVKEISQIQDPNFQSLAKGLSMGALMGARGNSGVILSQIFRGFSAVIGEMDQLDSPGLARALEHAAEVAYKAVIRPVEGTILTIIRSLAEAAAEGVRRQMELEDLMDFLRTSGYEALEKTPEQLPALKQAGVVDAGGKGLLCILDGAIGWMKGEIPSVTAIPGVIYEEKLPSELTEEDITYPYCTEFIVRGPGLDKDRIIRDLEQIVGDSLVVAVQDDVAKIHMHTENPGKLLEYGLSLGSLNNIKIDNMRAQFEQIHGSAPAAPAPRKPFGFVCVCAGDGLAEIAQSMGVDVVIQGGQTMNPSTEDIAGGIRRVNADVVYVLPNNKNIIMAAEQTRHILEQQEIVVIPARSFPQGMAALISFNPDLSPEENLETMSAALKLVKTAEVTYAVRDTELDGQTIRQGAILGLSDGVITVTGSDVHQVTLELISSLADGEEICTLYYGEQVHPQEAADLAADLESRFGDLEVDVYYGGQPLYYYIASLE